MFINNFFIGLNFKKLGTNERRRSLSVDRGILKGNARK